MRNLRNLTWLVRWRMFFWTKIGTRIYYGIGVLEAGWKLNRRQLLSSKPDCKNHQSAVCGQLCLNNGRNHTRQLPGEKGAAPDDKGGRQFFSRVVVSRDNLAGRVRICLDPKSSGLLKIKWQDQNKSRQTDFGRIRVATDNSNVKSKPHILLSGR